MADTKKEDFFTDGKVKKGGVNPKPSTARPATRPKGQAPKESQSSEDGKSGD